MSKIELKSSRKVTKKKKKNHNTGLIKIYSIMKREKKEKTNRMRDKQR